MQVPRIGRRRSFARRFTISTLFARRISADRSLALLSPYLLFPSTSMSFLVTPPPSLAVHSFEHRADSFSRRSPRWNVRRGRATVQRFARARAAEPSDRPEGPLGRPWLRLKIKRNRRARLTDPNYSLDPIEKSLGIRSPFARHNSRLRSAITEIRIPRTNFSRVTLHLFRDLRADFRNLSFSGMRGWSRRRFFSCFWCARVQPVSDATHRKLVPTRATKPYRKRSRDA